MKNILYKDFKCQFTNDNVCNWVDKEVDCYTKAFYKILPNGGFYFYILNVISHVDEPFDDYSEVDCIFSGIAYYDEIRHLYMGDEQSDNEGYLYYPNFELLHKSLTILKSLENTYCKES